MPPSYYSPSRDSSAFNQTPSLLNRILVRLPPGLAAQMHTIFNGQTYNSVSTHASRIPRSLRQARRNWHPRKLLNLPHAFVVLWVIVLLWGERWVFQSSIEACRWEKWERWPKEATPHHLILIADPQLIDPHSYPGRPWPLEKATILHTDNYMKRSYINLQKKLHPDTVLFLGDLFDGGREWKTVHGNVPDPAWMIGTRPSGEQAYVKTWGKKYGEDFWLKEYDRFGRIFYKYWDAGGAEAGPWQRGRKIITTLPGNHDLGFGANIKIPVRNRFEVYFGEGNRVDVIGNHTFVSIDAVSLSAGESEHDTAEITRPVEDFLAKVQVLKRMAVARELSIQAGEEKTIQHLHMVEDLDKADFEHLPTLDPGPGAVDLPTVLLTHVPLYRNSGTPCGPKREHWPPAKPPNGQNTPVSPDDRNAISISRGYQYQNVLSENDSVKVVSTIGNVVSVFSGDDHDYCEIVHPENKNHAREITVKSTSWAMGVRKPGFLMVSMWNPLGPDGSPLDSPSSGHGIPAQIAPTMENHLCLLPDQIGILIWYGIFLAFTLIILISRALLMPIFKLEPFSTPPYSIDSDDSLLPMTTKRREDVDPIEAKRQSDSSTSSTSSNALSNLAPRFSTARTRSASPAMGYELPSSQARFSTPPLINGAGYWGNQEQQHYGEFEKKDVPFETPKIRRKDTIVMKVWREAWQSVWRVAWVVLLVYFYLFHWG